MLDISLFGLHKFFLWW